jgi:hypothetical protein
MRHGAFSERVISAAAMEIREALLERYPYLADATFSEAIVRYCRAEGRSQLLHEYVMAKAESEGVEAVKPYLWAEVSRAEANAAKFGADCGLDAAGHSRIARDLGLAQNIRKEASNRNLSHLGERGRALREGGGTEGGVTDG